MISNVVSYEMTNDYFSKISATEQEEVKVESSVLGSGSRIIDWAKEILRFFRNP
ncbi:MAG: hypothetical protein R2852_00325 [Bacteroidia bacterium]